MFSEEKKKWSQLHVIIKSTYKEWPKVSNALDSQEVTLSRQMQMNSGQYEVWPLGILVGSQKSQIFDAQMRALLLWIATLDLQKLILKILPLSLFLNHSFNHSFSNCSKSEGLIVTIKEPNKNMCFLVNSKIYTYQSETQ